ncbi:MAG TPA: alcohol dehydrogenase family protein [Candidatus Polarisedimenticolaceae bacterium]|nr:alcohol dehydrogenase family protein [Candidatus Polarisedimenticolaceae bacterium]
MQALTFRGVQAIACEQLPDPAILEPGDAIVEVVASAICGSDLHTYHGREPVDAGTVMGHEFVGRVVEAGTAARGLARGDLVVSPFTTCCGSCFYCRSGLTARCRAGQLFGFRREGSGLHGAQARYVRVPLAETTLVRLPADLRPDAGLLLGDVLATGHFCARNAEVGPHGCYAIVGCGPVGLMAIVAARALGAERLFAIDSVPERLALAERWGARPLRVDREDVHAAIAEATEGRGADAVLELVGSLGAARLAYDLVRPGGTLSVVGVHYEDRFAFSPAEAYDKNLTYRVGRCPARRLIDELLPLARLRQDELALLFTHRLPLARGADGYAIFAGRQDGCIKVLLEP